MGKKITNDALLISPRKNTQHRNISRDVKDMMNPMENENNQIHSNMMPDTNINKKPSMMPGQNGSGKTEDNPQVEQERNETFVSGFDDMRPNGNQETPMNVQPNITNQEIVPKIAEQQEQHDDNMSKASKKDNEYLKFFKFYYDKNKTEHPNWTPSQVTTIVSLLWKKKKNHDKNTPSKANSIISRRSNKPMTAKDAFKYQHKEMDRQQLDRIWSKLPQESRNFWKRRGDEYGNSAKLSEVSSVKNGKAPTPIFNNTRLLLQQV